MCAALLTASPHRFAGLLRSPSCALSPHRPAPAASPHLRVSSSPRLLIAASPHRRVSSSPRLLALLARSLHRHLSSPPCAPCRVSSLPTWFCDEQVAGASTDAIKYLAGYPEGMGIVFPDSANEAENANLADRAYATIFCDSDDEKGDFGLRICLARKQGF